jgi:hypothetical protein
MITSMLFLCSAKAASKYEHTDQVPIVIRDCQGMPGFFLYGKPEVALFHFSQEILDDYAKRFQEAGFIFYGSIEENSYLDVGWVGDYKFDFTTVDKVMDAFANRVPSGYVMLKVHLWAPEWWIDRHPDQAIGFEIKPDKYEYVIGSGPKHESFASELWKREAGEGLKKLVQHILVAPYANRVMGIMVAGGTYGEWHPWQWTPDYSIDFSEPMRQAFIKYVRKKYDNDEHKLRKMWTDPEITFQKISVPPSSERCKGKVGFFCDPSKSHNVTDYYEAFHLATVEAIDYFCKIVKQASNGRLLTCVNYGYEADIPWATQLVHHRLASLGMQLDSVDIFSSPHSYYYRNIGDHGALRHYPQSLALHGKMFIDEADERTHLTTNEKDIFRYAKNFDESRQILWRAFANMASNGVGMWYMDHTSKQWYSDPAFFVEFAKIKKWADYSMSVSRKRLSDVAVINSTKSEFFITTQTDLTAQFNVSQINQLCRSGSPFDRYLIEDLAEGLIPEYKVYIFLDCFYLTDDQLRAIEKLKAGNRTLMWFYAPGFVTSDKLSVENMKKLTGILFKLDNKPFSEINVDLDKCPGAPKSYIMWKKSFGEFNRELSPRFIPIDTECEVWGRYNDTNGPSLVIKKMKDWKSVYSATGNLPWAIINQIYKEAGVFLYCANGDNLMVNESWLGIHTTQAGTKHIDLPKRSCVYDVIHDQLIGKDIHKFDVNLPAGITALFALSCPESAKAKSVEMKPEAD